MRRKKNFDWRVTLKEYEKEKSAILAKKESVDEWAKLSMDASMSDRERMIRIMMNNDPELKSNNYICMSYACSYQSMSEDFIRDALYINSGLAILGCWDEDIIEFALKCYLNIPKKGTGALYGNCFTDVKEAIDNEVFLDSNPEYHNFLNSKLEGYYKLNKQLKDFKISKRKDLIQQYLEAGDIAKSILNYKVEVSNRLDWRAIIKNQSLSDEFIDKYSRIFKGDVPEEGDDE